MYNTKKNIDKVKRGNHTFFLDPTEANLVRSKLKKDEYKIFKTYPDCNKIILYSDTKPKIKLYQIKSKIPLRHQDILGTIFSLNITNEMFGDIIVDEDKYFIYILEHIDNYIKTNLLFIKNSEIELEEKELNFLDSYHQKYEENSIIVSSLRIDTIIARITNTNRNAIIDKIKNKEILINYNILTKNSYILKENDIFSIRKFGKFKFIGIEKTTKKDNLIIKYLKYI